MRHLPIACLLAAGVLGAAERINHEGRILGTLPTVTTPTLFNTPAADAVVAAMQIMPRDNPWNEDISTRPLLANSAAMMTVIREQFSGDRQRAVLFEEMNYVLVPDAQPLVDINFTLYYEDADFNGGTSPIGRYPIPTNQPVEAWPANGEELYAYQRMTGGDRHSITVQPGVGRYFETWLATLTSNTPAWEAAIAEAAPVVAASGTLVLHATLRDQFADAISAGAPVWTVLPGGVGGSIAVDGTYTAPAASALWTDQVRATIGALSSTVTIRLRADRATWAAPPG